MALWEFLVELFSRFALTFQLDPWYFAAVERIGFLPREQIEAILRAFGHVVSGPVCGITVMRDDGQFNRTIPQIWIAEPSDVCPVNQLVFFVEHELHHVISWIRDGLTTWPGHD